MENKVKKPRVWELDAFRGIFIIGMVIVHALWDLQYMFGVRLDPNIFYQNVIKGAFDLAISYGAILFIVLSGISVTFGSKHVKRGAIVLGFGLIISLVMFLLNGMFGYVYFGILHLLGTCMLLYALFKKMPLPLLCICAVAALALGYYIKTVQMDFWPLAIVGFDVPSFSAADHFPLFPNLGWFIVGIIIGKTVYKKKQSRLPKAISKNFLVKFFMLCGKHSLWIYVLHQPIVYGVLFCIFKIIR